MNLWVPKLRRPGRLGKRVTSHRSKADRIGRGAEPLRGNLSVIQMPVIIIQVYPKVYRKCLVPC